MRFLLISWCTSVIRLQSRVQMTYISIHQSVYVSSYLYIYLYIYISIHPSVYVYIYIYISIHIYISVYVSSYLCLESLLRNAGGFFMHNLTAISKLFLFFPPNYILQIFRKRVNEVVAWWIYTYIRRLCYDEGHSSNTVLQGQNQGEDEKYILVCLER